MYEAIVFIIVLTSLPFLLVAWKLLINYYKLYSIRRAVQQGKCIHLYLRNNYRNTHGKLKELEQTAASKGYSIVVTSLNFDRDHPGLPTAFDVVVHPSIKLVQLPRKGCLKPDR
jgi:hypothetical protein